MQTRTNDIKPGDMERFKNTNADDERNRSSSRNGQGKFLPTIFEGNNIIIIKNQPMDSDESSSWIHHIWLIDSSASLIL